MVSVIIPTYKSPTTLPRAVNSVLAQQGYEDFEIVVVDDNAPDSVERKETESVMESYTSNPKVKYIKQPQNLNGAAARNRGIKESHGDLICFLDDDDIFLPLKLVKQVQYMNSHPEYGASYTGRVNKTGSISLYYKVGDLSEDILTMKFLPTTITLMFRRECLEEIGGFDESFTRHQDFQLLLSFFQCFEIGVIPEPLSQIIGGRSNTPHGAKLEQLKRQFLDAFEDVINHIDERKPGFKKEVYSVHYASVFYDHMSKHYLIRGLKIFLVYTWKYQTSFLREITHCVANAYNYKKQLKK